MGNNDIDLANEAFFDGRDDFLEGNPQDSNPFPDGTMENRFWNDGWRWGEICKSAEPVPGPCSSPLDPAFSSFMYGTAYIPKDRRFETEEDPWCHSCDHAIHDCRCDG